MEKETGIEVEKSADGTLNVVFEANSWIKVAKVDFGTGATSVELRVAAAADGQLEIVLDNAANAPIAVIPVKSTGSLSASATQTAKISGIKGVHDVYYRAKGRFNLDWYKFIK
jgi:hypothetical protein